MRIFDVEDLNDRALFRQSKAELKNEELEVTAVDYFGNTEGHELLQRAFVYNGPMWAVWVHYFPHTELVQ